MRGPSMGGAGRCHVRPILEATRVQPNSNWCSAGSSTTGTTPLKAAARSRRGRPQGDGGGSLGAVSVASQGSITGEAGHAASRGENLDSLVRAAVARREAGEAGDDFHVRPAERRADGDEIISPPRGEHAVRRGERNPACAEPARRPRPEIETARRRPPSGKIDRETSPRRRGCRCICQDRP